MPALKNPPIPLPAYERIFRTIHGVLLNEDSTPEKACLYFALIGAFLVDRHHHLKPAVRIGAAAYNLRTPTNAVLVLGTVENGALVSSETAFHCWVEVEGWIIDFAAPLFQDMIDPSRTGGRVPPRMFQKPSTSLPSIESLNASGAYAHEGNPAIHDDLVNHFRSFPANGDLAEICSEWYRPPPKKVPEFIQVSNQRGEARRVVHTPIRVAGAW